MSSVAAARPVRTTPVVKSAVVVVAAPAARPRPWADRLTVVAFALFLTLPLVVAVARPAPTLATENRTLAPPPSLPAAWWKPRAVPFAFDAYWKDRVGFRPELLALRRAALVEGLGVSTSDAVWIGRDGWLFMNVVGPGGLPAAQPDPVPRFRRWAAALEARRGWLAARGVPYVVLLAPEKSSVYPEFLPVPLRRHPPADHVARLKDLIPAVPLVDPLPALVAAKGAEPLYHHTDSHWTDAGAFVAYADLGRAIGRAWPAYRGKALADFRQRPWVLHHGDLTMALGYPAGSCPEAFTLFHEPDGTTSPQPVDQLAAALEKYPDRLRHLAPTVTESRRGTGRAVLLHDSFGLTLQRHLASDFARLTAVGTYGFPRELVEAERPDVVIQVVVARSLAFVDAEPFSTMTP